MQEDRTARCVHCIKCTCTYYIHYYEIHNCMHVVVNGNKPSIITCLLTTYLFTYVIVYLVCTLRTILT